MVAVYVQVAAAGDAYIKQAVAGEAVQHVVKKADARVQVGPAGAVQVNRQRDLCLPRIAGAVAVRAIGIPLFSALN